VKYLPPVLGLPVVVYRVLDTLESVAPSLEVVVLVGVLAWAVEPVIALGASASLASVARDWARRHSCFTDSLTPDGSADLTGCAGAGAAGMTSLRITSGFWSFSVSAVSSSAV